MQSPARWQPDDAIESPLAATPSILQLNLVAEQTPRRRPPGTAQAQAQAQVPAAHPAAVVVRVAVSDRSAHIPHHSGPG
jgi:hypothetical protein